MVTHNRTILDELTVTDKPEKFDEATMGLLAEAVNSLITAQDQITTAEESLKILKNAEREINQNVIPQLMDNLGLATLGLKDGRTLAVKESVQCGISVANRPKAYVWMDDNGHGDLIKIAITAKFARGERDVADEAFNALIDVGCNPNQTESVHAGTLKAWARLELEQGHSLPADLFNVHVVKMTTVK